MSFISELATERTRNLVPYQSARRIGGAGRVFLNANEAPKSSLFLMKSLTLNRYPECQPPEVLEAYSDYCGVPAENILVSRGSDESLGLLVRAFCEPGRDAVLISPPTYGMYSVCADTAGVRVAEVPLTDDFRPDPEAIGRALDANAGRIKIVFVCSPNNPTGAAAGAETILRILDLAANRCLVVVDEAYIEFCPEKSVLGHLAARKNLVVTRTLSKAFALAGIRCGFTLADPEIVGLMLKVIDPYPIPDPVAQIAVQALSARGIAIMRERVAEIVARRDRFARELAGLACVREIFPGDANYVLARFADGEKIFAELARRGIILRDFDAKPRLKDCVRVTVGSEEEMNAVLEALRGAGG